MEILPKFKRNSMFSVSVDLKVPNRGTIFYNYKEASVMCLPGRYTKISRKFDLATIVG